MKLLNDLCTHQLIQPPKFVPDNMHYAVITGSVAYGMATDTSDLDIYGFCIPPKEQIFRHLAGEIEGFGKPKNKFEQWIQHHIDFQNKQYDFTVFSIVKYFQLCMENNPNMIDTLFVPQNCIIHSTQVGNYVRDNRRQFLHKGSWFKFKGYAYSQLVKCKSQTREGKRKEVVEKWGYDLKFASHVVRLLNEIEQILIEGDLDLQRNNEQLKAIRRGEWTLEQLDEYFNKKEPELETAYTNSPLRHSPDEDAIKAILLKCLEMHYGSLDKAIVIEGKEKQILRKIKELCEEII